MDEEVRAPINRGDIVRYAPREEPRPGAWQRRKGNVYEVLGVVYMPGYHYFAKLPEVGIPGDFFYVAVEDVEVVSLAGDPAPQNV